MISFEQARQILDDVMDSLPPEIFQGLNGGVVLLDEAPQHPESVNGSLYIMGQYHYQPNGLGRFINIYYGSLARLYGNASYQAQAAKLKEVLHHELVHHLEGMAGDKSLELKDRENIDRYKKRFGAKLSD